MSSKRELYSLNSDLGGYWGTIKPRNMPIWMTKLGKLVDAYLTSVFGDYDEGDRVVNYYTEECQQAVIDMIEQGGADVVAPFFEPLDGSLM
mmetsp:Transcript_35106/g.84734  ORF Transcript_35106/g.84734 Transcript_35106/m.84734 type:complete len:91 (+) Transcript_35106:99-371(+)